MIYTRRYWWLLAIMVFGTFNRETTLFLIPLFVLDAVSAGDETAIGRFRWADIPWMRALLLAVLWAAVEIPLSRHFAGNDRSETYSRLRENMHRLKPSSWPVLLNMCGYLLPFVVVMSPLIRPRRFGNYSILAVVWVLAMLWYGVITETRIYGELVPYVAVSAVLLLEEYVGTGAVGLNADSLRE